MLGILLVAALLSAGGMLAVSYIRGLSDDYRYINQDIGRFIDR